MSYRDSKSLDDTLPLEKNESGFGSSEEKNDSYGSDLSVSTGNNSTNSSVKIVYEFINLSDSKSDKDKNKE